MEVHGRRVGLDGRSRAQSGNSSTELILSGKRDAQTEMGHRGVRIEQEDTSKCHLGRGVMPELLQSHPEIVMSINKLGGELDRTPVARLGLRRASRAVECSAEMEVRAGETAPRRYRPRVSGDRVLDPPGIQVQRAEIVEAARLV